MIEKETYRRKRRKKRGENGALLRLGRSGGSQYGRNGPDTAARPEIMARAVVCVRGLMGKEGRGKTRTRKERGTPATDSRKGRNDL